MVSKEQIREALWEIPAGWEQAFGDTLVDELYEAAIADGMDDDWCILQMKEKFGELCVYPNWYGDHIEAVIDKYEKISRRTCVLCGEPATCISLGWVSPYCDACMEKHGGDSVAIDEFLL